MRILDRLFKRDGTMTATAERSPIETNLRLAELQIQIDAGDGNIAEAIEEKARLERELQASKLRAKADGRRAFREARAAARADLDARSDEVVTRINTHAVGLLFAAQDLQKIVDELHAGSPGADGREFTEIFSGLDHTFAAKVTAAIHAVADVEWDYDVAYPGGKEGKPSPRTFLLRLPPAAKTDIHNNPVGTVYQ